MVTTLIVKSQSVKTDQPCKTGTLSLRQPNWPLGNTWSILSLTRSSPKNIHSNSLRSLCNTSSRENSKRFRASLPHSPRQMAPHCLNTRWRDDPVSYAEFLISLFQGKKQGLEIRTLIRNILFFVSSFLSLFLFFTETSQFGNSFSWGHLFLENLTSRNQFCYLLGKG